MIEIILDATQLELFEACPRKWCYSHVLNLVPLQSKRHFDIGSYYHEVLQFYYSNLKDPDIFRKTIDFLSDPKLYSKWNIEDIEEKTFHKKRIIYYLNQYMDDAAQMVIVAAEKGFSRLLYESYDRRYILEGKIDLIGTMNPYGIFVMDHKTQSRFDDKWEFNHQVCNYMSFTGADYFIYNYIGLQATLPKDGLRRKIYKPHPGMLKQWEKEVKITFDELFNYLSDGYGTLMELRAEGDFPRRRGACDSSKYGLCQYHKLCSVPDDSPFKGAVLSAYKEKDEIWRAWT